MSSSLSNHDSGLNTVLGTTSTTTAYDDDLRPASIVRGPNSTKASSVMISGRAPTQGAGFTASIIPIEQRVTPTTASGDDKLLSGRECIVHRGGGATAGSAAAPDEAAAVSSCERECGSNDDAVHTDTNRRRNNHSECDSSATAASTDKYSCDLEGTMEVGGSGGGSSSSSNTADHEEEVSLQVVRKATAEYSSSARESEAAGDYDHRDNNVDRDDHHEAHGHDTYNYDDEGGRDNYYEDEDDDACRTPTASECRIPNFRPCPPPPRKPRAVLMNDKSCSTIGTTSSDGKLCPAHQQHQQHHHHHHHGGRLLLDFSKEVESMFPPLVQVNLGRKIKKARTA